MRSIPRGGSGVRRVLVGGAVLTTIAVIASTAAAGAEPRATYGSATIAFTREDTTSIDVTESFASPGANPVVGDFVGGTSPAGLLDDIFWYTPGSRPELIWRTTGERSWVESDAPAFAVNGTYTPIVGHFTTTDAKADIFWYAPGPATDWLWDFNDDGSLTKRTYKVNGTYTPITGDFSGDGAEDIIWYGPGPAGDSWWDFEAGGLTTRPLVIGGTYTAVVGSFAGTGRPTFDDAHDILWYAPGSPADALWDFKSDHTIVKTPLAISGTYQPVAGNFTADGFDDVLWYAPGPAKDHLWDFDDANGDRTQTALTINGTYIPITGELFEDSDHRTDIVWFRPGTGADFIWDYAQSDVPVSLPVNLTGNLTPVLGTFEYHPFTPQGGDTSTGGGLDIVDRSR